MNLMFGLRRRGRALWMPVVAVALLAACGGGTNQVKAFQPNRLIAFGDEASLIVDDGNGNGRKYGINGLNASSALDCTLLPNWVQTLAGVYSMVFAECNSASATPKAFMRAKANARVADPALGIAAQVAEQTAAGGAPGSGDLVTLMIGVNDIIELGTQVQAGTMTANDAVAEARRRGSVLAERINDILATGARAIVSTVPDVGLTPLARAMEAGSPGSAARMTALTVEFNGALRTSIDSTRFDGRNYGLVLADDLVSVMARVPDAYALSNITTGACVKALPDCSSATADLVASASASSHLWADDRRLGPTAQLQIGAQASSRARGNPF